MTPLDYDYLQKILKERSGLMLSSDKKYLLESRLLPLARKMNLAGIPELVQKMRSGSESTIRDVVEAMTTNETFFFRDKTPFDHFKNSVIPELIKARANRKSLRIWCAASSTGQEPYSLAMIVDEEARNLAGWTVDVVATDIADSVLKKAKDGVYTHFEAQRGLPAQHLVRYFSKRKDNWVINQHIRSRVDFRQQNLMADFSALGQFDVIFCRNVLIYFAPDQKRDVLNRMAQRLAPDGFLVLGAAESVIGYSSEFKPHSSNRVILTRRAATPHHEPARAGASLEQVRTAK